MPAKSRQQYKFFQAMLSNPEEAKQKGISKPLAHEYTDPITKDRWKNLKNKLSKKK